MVSKKKDCRVVGRKGNHGGSDIVKEELIRGRWALSLFKVFGLPIYNVFLVLWVLSLFGGKRSRILTRVSFLAFFVAGCI